MLKKCLASDRSEAVLSALVTLLLLALAIACFIGSWVAPDLVALLAAGPFMATRVLTPNETLAGLAVLLDHPGGFVCALQQLAAHLCLGSFAVALQPPVQPAFSQAD